jgi:hypothetical protein
MDRLANAFTRDGLVKGLWNFGSAEQQPVPAVHDRRTGPLPGAGIVARGMGSDDFGPDGVGRELAGILDHDYV